MNLRSSHNGPSLEPHWKPWTMLSFTELNRALSTWTLDAEYNIKSWQQYNNYNNNYYYYHHLCHLPSSSADRRESLMGYNLKKTTIFKITPVSDNVEKFRGDQITC